MTEKSIYSGAYRQLTLMLKYARKRAGFSQVGLAEQLGGDQSFVSKIERNERRIDLEEVRKICEILEVPFLEFVADWEASIHPPGELTDVRGMIREPSPENNGWSMVDWKQLLESLVKAGILSYRDIAVLALEYLHPSQFDATPPKGTAKSARSVAEGGRVAMTTKAALMWVLLTKRPENYRRYKALCREYGMGLNESQYEAAWKAVKRIGKLD